MINISPIQFKQVVKRILKEEIEKSDEGHEINKRVPEVNHGSDYKDVIPHKNDVKSKQEILDDIKKTVSALNKDFVVKWDDHDDIRIDAEDLYKIRIIPKWENTYCIEAYNKNEDRIYVSNQTLDQVKQFIKDNLKVKDTNVEKNYKRSLDNNKIKPIDEPDKGLPQKNKTVHKKVTDTVNKNKDYTEDQTKKKEDLPDKPMKEVNQKDIKLQRDYSVKGEKATYKFPKQKNNKLVIKQK